MRKVATLLSSAVLASLLAPGAVSASTATRGAFGQLPDGTKIEAVTLTGANGVRARIMTLGATLQSFEVPDRNGKAADITLGHDTAAEYVTQPNFWGQTVGRYANRIAGGRFVLDGKTYQLPLNDKTNSLHGGTTGFDKAVWRIVSVKQGPQASVTMALTSPAGDQGYPGTLNVTATYTLDDNGALTIDMDAKTDAPTIVNLTNHALFNLAGEGSQGGIYAQRMTVPAARYTPVDAALIPTGELKPVAGTPFDFTQGRVIGQDIRDGRDPQIVLGRGYDHNFVLDKGRTAEPKLAARVEDAASGRVLEVLTTEPGVQFYTGNFLDGTIVGKQGHVYRMGDAFALEPQVFPDTPNHPAFGSARVDPGKPYHHRMIYRVSVAR
ncbi:MULTISPECIES: aldose epimerase family protein [unclassified Sphingomonas]|jgi:aldose 1-epimerase|uniref:aldose epimerase family protein n=1 Tax=unclassified Sphingomonas TaxID=196159 RepID=UPI000E106544|nr:MULTISPECIES: aldose epimerase family protein [unclassified Sphingomonas]AXJ95567.1 galactose-1-epimerase [Sphingomonas sp. FARSPH]